MKTRVINTPEELTEFKVFMKMFWAGYPNANASEETLMLYNEDFAELPIQDLRAAYKILRRKSVYLPAISEVYAEVEAIQKQRDKQKLLATSSQPTLAQMMEWKREPIPQDILSQLPEWKSVLEKKAMCQKVTNPIDKSTTGIDDYWSS